VVEKGQADPSGEAGTDGDGGHGAVGESAATGSNEGLREDVPSKPFGELLLPEGAPFPSGEDLEPGVWVTQSQGSADLAEAASELLLRYRSRGDCVLARAGTIDLFGDVWACVVQGGPWADICVVSSDVGGRGCKVSVLHLRAQEAQALLERREP
jgi:hypothetical protein